MSRRRTDGELEEATIRRGEALCIAARNYLDEVSLFGRLPEAVEEYLDVIYVLNDKAIHLYERYQCFVGWLGIWLGEDSVPQQLEGVDQAQAQRTDELIFAVVQLVHRMVRHPPSDLCQGMRLFLSFSIVTSVSSQ